jgi:hypothetical protein
MSVEFPWQEYEDGTEYLRIRDKEFCVDITDNDRTVLFLYAGKLAMFNHIWVEMPEQGETEDTVMGARIWQRSFDEQLGEGLFMELCDQLINRGYAQAAEDEPSELDYQAFYNTFPDAKEEEVDTIVERLMTNFDAAIQYYTQEWTEQYG